MITKPIELVVCGACHKHAHFILPSGFIGPEFAFKRHGYEILYVAVQTYGLSFIESGHMREQIQASPLADEHLAVDGHLLWAADRWNELLVLRHPALPNISFHRLLRKTKKRPLPSDFFEVLDNHLNVGIHPQNPKAKKLF